MDKTFRVTYTIDHGTKEGVYSFSVHREDLTGGAGRRELGILFWKLIEENILTNMDPTPHQTEDEFVAWAMQG